MGDPGSIQRNSEAEQNWSPQAACDQAADVAPVSAQELQQKPCRDQREGPDEESRVGLQKSHAVDRGCRQFLKFLNGSSATRLGILAVVRLFLALCFLISCWLVVKALLQARWPLHGVNLPLGEGNGDPFFLESFPDLPAQITAHCEGIQRVGHPEQHLVVDR